MHFVAIFISALFFANLAVPSQPPEPFRLGLVRDPFCAAYFGAAHLDLLGEDGGWDEEAFAGSNVQVFSQFSFFVVVGGGVTKTAFREKWSMG